MPEMRDESEHEKTIGMSAAEHIARISDEIDRLLWLHQAMSLVDHDGGDEDDQLVVDRQFLRAIRRPRSYIFRQRDRLYAVQVPDLMVPLLPVRFNDPGDEQ